MLEQLPAPDNDRYRFTCSSGDHADEQYELRLSVCPNPVCRCGSISIQMTSDASTDHGVSLPPATFLIDVMNGCLDTTGDKTMQAEQALGELFVDRLSDEDWASLRGIFFSVKRFLTENAADEDLDVYFPVSEIDRDSLMVDFHQILPYAETKLVEACDKRFALMEHYCVKPGCSCSDVFVTLMNADVVSEVPSADDEPVLVIDYKSRSWRVERLGRENAVLLEHLGTRLSTEDDARHFQARHDRLRSLYLLYKQRHRPGSSARVRDARKVGRNDPCPCGSGKKYKKCCLGSAGR
ncbi:SEC-C metal-binding domain-containing protein [Thiocapsa sp.]|uniref:SEC-C metal-binding domain-containing protein n=1 Tax=Thiocapsa sp. TaxID=2024551 RepID=UPI002BE242C1|nr:SEC-C metal-binding domain-containing protein [Thiocapsa sp.]HSO84675.1 SEC-C metal-binding domain-containing protein [Thiocapsa sp.]